jgi:hypothetical protein
VERWLLRTLYADHVATLHVDGMGLKLVRSGDGSFKKTRCNIQNMLLMQRRGVLHGGQGPCNAGPLGRSLWGRWLALAGLDGADRKNPLSLLLLPPVTRPLVAVSATVAS